jgi:hypothetical protein
MNADFTPEQAGRWDAWQRANALSARRGDRISRAIGATISLVLLIAVGVAIWRLTV